MSASSPTVNNNNNNNNNNVSTLISLCQQLLKEIKRKIDIPSQYKTEENRNSLLSSSSVTTQWTLKQALSWWSSALHNINNNNSNNNNKNKLKSFESLILENELFWSILLSSFFWEKKKIYIISFYLLEQLLLLSSSSSSSSILYSELHWERKISLFLKLNGDYTVPFTLHRSVPGKGTIPSVNNKNNNNNLNRNNNNNNNNNKNSFSCTVGEGVYYALSQVLFFHSTSPLSIILEYNIVNTSNNNNNINNSNNKCNNIRLSLVYRIIILLKGLLGEGGGGGSDDNNNNSNNKTNFNVVCLRKFFTGRCITRVVNAVMQTVIHHLIRGNNNNNTTENNNNNNNSNNNKTNNDNNNNNNNNTNKISHSSGTSDILERACYVILHRILYTVTTTFVLEATADVSNTNTNTNNNSNNNNFDYSTTFATATVLEDYIMDVAPQSNYYPISVIASSEEFQTLLAAHYNNNNNNNSKKNSIPNGNHNNNNNNKEERVTPRFSPLLPTTTNNNNNNNMNTGEPHLYNVEEIFGITEENILIDKTVNLLLHHQKHFPVWFRDLWLVLQQTLGFCLPNSTNSDPRPNNNNNNNNNNYNRNNNKKKRSSSGGGKEKKESEATRRKELVSTLVAFQMLEIVFQLLPVANCVEEHRCSNALRLLLSLVKKDLCAALAYSFAHGHAYLSLNTSNATAATNNNNNYYNNNINNYNAAVNSGSVGTASLADLSFRLLECSFEIITQLFRKVHYLLRYELYALCVELILPLLLSPVASFRQKHAFLRCLHSLFEVPHLIISLFINYDCNPTFDLRSTPSHHDTNNNNNNNSNENSYSYSGSGGFITAFLDFIVEMAFTDYLSTPLYYNNNNNNSNDNNSSNNENGNNGSTLLNCEAWLNSDQQQLLRSECALLLHEWASSLYRWIASDPHTYAVEELNRHRPPPNNNNNNNTNKRTQLPSQQSLVFGGGVLAELYRDSWSSDEDNDPDVHQNNNSNNNNNKGGDAAAGSGAAPVRSVSSYKGSSPFNVHLNNNNNNNNNNTTTNNNSISLSASSVESDSLGALIASEQQWNPLHPPPLGGVNNNNNSSPLLYTTPSGGEDPPLLPPPVLIHCYGRNKAIRYHWKHLHFLLHNKRLLMKALELLHDSEGKKWREAKAYLESHQFIPKGVVRNEEEAFISFPFLTAETTNDRAALKEYQEQEDALLEKIKPGESSVAYFARFLIENPTLVSRDALSSIFEKINKPKDRLNLLLLREYFHLFHYEGVPIDVALRDTTCRFISWSRPMLEAKVWEKIQRCFGQEYAAQNPNYMSAEDAEVMVGVLLFLHTNLHNVLAKDQRLTSAQFVEDCNACLEIPLEQKEVEEIYSRIKEHKWELDVLQRTPQEVEALRRQGSLAAKVKWALLKREGEHLEQERRARRQREQQQQHQDPMAMLKETQETTPEKKPNKEEEGEENDDDDNEDGEEIKKDNSENNSINNNHENFSAVLKEADSEDPTEPSTPDQGLPRPSTNPTTTSTPRERLFTPSTAQMEDIFSQLNTVFSPARGTQRPTTNNNNTNNTDSDAPWLYFPSSIKDAPFRLKEEQHQHYHHLAQRLLRSLDYQLRHHAEFSAQQRPQPYCMPHYAEHVRPLLLSFYPPIMAALYLFFRVLEEAPMHAVAMDTVTLLYEIAAAFVINVGDLQTAVEECVRRHLEARHGYRLGHPTRVSFIPFIMNCI